MALFLKNSSKKLHINYPGNGLLSLNNQEITNVEKLSIDNLDEILQTKLESIDTINTDISNIQINLGELQTTVDNLSNGGGGGGGGGDGVGINLDDAIFTMTNTATISNNNFAKIWYDCSNSGSPNIFDIVCSGDGRVCFVCAWVNGPTQMSLNYGETWISNPSGISNTITSAALSLDGKYVIVSDSNNFKISSDYGTTFTFPYPRPFQVNSLAISATGKYIISGCQNGQGLQVSSDYGVSWLQKETSVWIWSSVCTSLDGSIMYACSNDGLIKKTVDYGNNWQTIFTDSSSRDLKYICCSGDGKYILICYRNSEKLLLSKDYGDTFNLVGNANDYYKVVMSMNGVYMAAVKDGLLYYSIDSGNTWKSITNSKFRVIAMSYTGDVMYNIQTYNKVNISQKTNTLVNTIQPIIATAGSQYYDITTNRLYIYNGTAWKYVAMA